MPPRLSERPADTPRVRGDGEEAALPIAKDLVALPQVGGAMLGHPRVVP